MPPMLVGAAFMMRSTALMCLLRQMVLRKKQVITQSRGAKVIEYGRTLLDQSAPLAKGSHQDAIQYTIVNQELQIQLSDNTEVGLAEPTQLAGYQGSAENPESILLQNNRLHIEVQVDHNSQIGTDDPAGIKDILMEAALTTIMDCEDSVAAVDAEDKALIYSNWLGLMKGQPRRKP